MFKSKFQVSTKHFIIGILFGLIFANIFFCFLVLGRDFLRQTWFKNNYFLELSNHEVYFFNFFYAFIALLVSKSIVFTYWIRQNNINNLKYFYIKKRIVSEQWNFLNYFIFFFTKISSFISFIGIEIFYLLDSFNKYFYIYLLILLVLFLHSWQVFILKHKNGYKIMFISFLFILFASFLFTFMSINNEDIIKNYNNENEIVKKTKIKLPISNYYEEQKNNNNINFFRQKEENYILTKNDTLNFTPIKFNDYNKTFYTINNDFKELNNLFNYNHKIYSNLDINCDKNIKMKDVNTLKIILLYSSFRRINYKVLPKKMLSNKEYYKSCILPYNIYCIQNKSNTIDNAIKIKLYKDSISLNNRKIDYFQFEKEYIKIFEKNPAIIVEVSFDNESNFQQYISIYSLIIRESIKYKDKISYKKYNRKYNDIYDDDKKYIIDSVSKFKYREVIHHKNVIEIINFINSGEVLPPPPDFYFSE